MEGKNRLPEGAEVLSDILDLLSERACWIVLTHEKPDGDTIGSAAALAMAGRRAEKKVLFGGPDAAPVKYEFLCEGLDYRALPQIPQEATRGDAVIVCVDTSTPERSVPWLLSTSVAAARVNIDHHPDNPLYADLNWVAPQASATAEMATELLFRSPWGIRPEEADALYTGLVTDNGGFRFSSTTTQSHACAIRLIEAGASPSRVADLLECALSANILRLWGRVLSRAETFAEGCAALYWIALEDFAQTGTSREDTENLVNFLLRIRGVRLAALCSESEDGVRVSLRSRPPLSARTVAAKFGGGGHELASGCTIRTGLSEAIAALRREMERYAGTGDSSDR